MKKLLCFLALTLALLNFPARTSQFATIVLNPSNWASGKLPSDWQIKVNRGKPIVAVCQEKEASCLHLKSVNASFALERSVDVDPYQTRFLSWRWKVTELPPGADFRHVTTDDQAAQLLVAFADRHVLTYIWDTSAPKGTMQNASSIPLVHIYAIVCESGAQQINQWVAEAQDVAADYERAYGKPAPRVKGLRIQINSQHTGTTAESYFGEVAFRSTLAQ